MSGLEKTSADQAPDQAKVFLSYSRKDRERAQGVAEALRSRHFGVFKDTDDILPTEEWKTRLQDLIEEADTIVFLLSPHSAVSEVCAWEVEYASALNKRIAPIVIEDVEGTNIPPLLARLNFIFCTPRDPFEDAVDTLASALSTDIEWIREHTRLAGLARRWGDAGKPARLLLRGQDIADSEGWRDGRPPDAPAVTAAQAGLIAESRRAAGRRQRNWITGALGVSVATAGLAVFAWFQSVEADRQRVEADAQRVEAVAQRAEAEAQRAEADAQRAEAETQRAEAETQRAVAEANEVRAQESAAAAARERDQALRTQSLFLADLSRQRLAAGDDGDALALALEAVPEAPEMNSRPLVPEAMEALREVYLNFRMRARLPENFGYGMGLATSPHGKRLVLGLSEDGLVLNFAEMDLEAAYDGYENGATAAVYSPAGDSFAMGSRGGLVTVFDAETLDPLASTRVNGPVFSLAYSPDGAWLAAGPAADDESRPVVMQARTGEVLYTLETHGGDVSGVGFTPEGGHLITSSHDGAARIFRLNDGALLGGVHASKYGLNALVMKPGAPIAAIAESERVVLVDLTTGEVIEGFEAGLTPFALTWAPDGDLFVGYIDGSVRRWREEESAPVAQYVGHSRAITALSVSADGTRLFSASRDEALIIWEVAADMTHRRIDAEWDASAAYGFDGDGAPVVFAADDAGAVLSGEAGDVATPLAAALADAGLGADHATTIDAAGRFDLWARDGAHLGGIETGLTGQTFAHLVAGGKVIETWGEDSGSTFWRYPEGTRIALNAGQVHRSMTTATGERIAYVADGGVEWIDLSGGQVVRRRLEGAENPTALQLSPDGALLAVSVSGAPAHIYRLADGDVIARLDAIRTTSRKLAFSPDGRFLAAAGLSNSLSLWRVADWSLVRVTQARDHVADFEFSPDGALLAVSGIDGQVQVLRTVDGKRHIRYPEPLGTGASLRFSADAARLLVRTTDGVVVYSVFPDDAALVERATKRASRFAALTSADRCNYFLSFGDYCAVEKPQDKIVVTLPDFD